MSVPVLKELIRKAESEGTGHYYGGIVRKLFLFGAIVMLISLPFFHDFVPTSISVSILVILVIGVAAGLISPRYVWTAALNTLIAVGAFSTFEYYAFDAYASYATKVMFFWVNQVLALTFLVALYYGVKTVRGLIEENTS